MAPVAVENVIRAGEAYPLPIFKRLTGMGDAAMRAARKNGLPLKKVGTRTFILGADWLSYLERQPARVDD